MKNKLLILVTLLTAVIFVGCQSEDDLKGVKSELKTEIEQLSNQRNKIQSDIRSLETKNKDLMSNVSHLENIKDGKRCKYLFTLELKQSHISLSLKKHLKDAMNKIRFDIMVDEDLYKSQNVGDELLREFRKGSFLTSGSVGKWVIKVVDKKIIYVD